MKFALALAATFALATGCAELAPRDSREVKIAFDITDGNPQMLLAKLQTIERTRKQIAEAGMTPRIVLAFRSGATQYTQADVSGVKPDDRADALRVAAALRTLAATPGVESLEQCNLTLERMKLSGANLMQPIKVVPNSWISLAAYQQRGYSYIAP